MAYVVNVQSARELHLEFANGMAVPRPNIVNTLPRIPGLATAQNNKEYHYRSYVQDVSRTHVFDELDKSSPKKYTLSDRLTPNLILSASRMRFLHHTPIFLENGT